jgi:ABC-2 type transport system permease protein
MRRILRLFFRYALFSIMTALEYRSDFIITAIVRFLESAVSFLVILLLFRQITSLSGWTAPQVLLINITYSLGTGLICFLCKNSLKQLAESLNKGNIDRYLVKPIDFQLLASLGGFDWTQMFRIIFSTITVIWLLIQYSIPVTILSGVLYLILIIISSFIFYCLAMTTTFLTFFVGRINNINYLPYLFWDFGKVPTTIYSGMLGVIFSVFIPVITAATIPVGVLVQKMSPFFVLHSLIAALIMFGLCRLVLVTGLRRYSSASS